MGRSGPVSYPPSHPVSLALMSGRPQLIREVPEGAIDASAPTAESARFASAVGLRSLMALPLRRRDQIQGVLSFARSVSGRGFDDEDLARRHRDRRPVLGRARQRARVREPAARRPHAAAQHAARAAAATPRGSSRSRSTCQAAATPRSAATGST